MKKRDILKKMLLLGGMVYTAGQIIRARRTMQFSGRVAVITGGSRGLGLILARLLCDEGAKVALLARDESELQRAKVELQQNGAAVLTIACDVTDENAVRSAIERTAQHYGGIDILINNAGSIAVGPLEHMTEGDFQQMMDLHCWATLHATRAALPHLKMRGGRVMNITSLGGLIPVPHLSAYNVSKFAQVGLSGSLRSELAKDGVLVTTVCPGPMRTGSHVNAEFKGHHEKEFRLFTLFNGPPVVSADARTAAGQMLDALRHGDAMLVLPLSARIQHVLSALAPNMSADVMGFMTRFLPPVAGPEGDERRTGWESRGHSGPSALTQLSDEAANRNNELRGHAPLPVPSDRSAFESMSDKAHLN